MTRTLLIAASLLSLTASPTLAAPCKDAKGKFVKCPPARKAPVRCKGANGKFVACTAPGAKPI